MPSASAVDARADLQEEQECLGVHAVAPELVRAAPRGGPVAAGDALLQQHVQEVGGGARHPRLTVLQAGQRAPGNRQPGESLQQARTQGEGDSGEQGPGQPDDSCQETTVQRRWERRLTRPEDNTI